MGGGGKFFSFRCVLAKSVLDKSRKQMHKDKLLLFWKYVIALEGITQRIVGD